MRRHGLIVLSVLFATLSLSTTCWAAPTLGRHKVREGHYAYLRSYAQSWYIGQLRAGEHFYAQEYQSGYFWGYAVGSFNGCAWVRASVDGSNSKLVHLSASRGPKDCGPARRLALNDYRHMPAHGKPTTRRAAVASCPVAQRFLYRNYRDGRFIGERVDLSDAVRSVGWRYTTGDRQAAAVNYRFPGGSKVWAFVRRACLPPDIENPRAGDASYDEGGCDEPDDCDTSTDDDPPPPPPYCVVSCANHLGGTRVTASEGECRSWAAATCGNGAVFDPAGNAIPTGNCGVRYLTYGGRYLVQTPDLWICAKCSLRQHYYQASGDNPFAVGEDCVRSSINHGAAFCSAPGKNRGGLVGVFVGSCAAAP